MYAIVEDSGTQFRVEEGQVLDVDLRGLEEGADTIEFDKVLLLSEGNDVKIGAPVLEGVKVVAKIQDEIKAPKIDVVNYIRRKGHLTRKGHRQRYLRVKIESINA